MRRKMINRAVSMILSIAMVLSTPISTGYAYANELDTEVLTAVETEENESVFEVETSEAVSEEASEVVSEASTVEATTEISTEVEETTTVETTEETTETTVEETSEEIDLEAVSNFKLDADGRLSLASESIKVGGSMVLPTGTKIIPAGIFDKNTTLTSLTVEGGTSYITTIEAGAFKGCTGLASVPTGNVTTIGASAFEGCKSLTTCSLSSVVTIGESAFKDCIRFTAKEPKESETTFSDKITSIGNYAFENTGIVSLDVTGLKSSVSLGKGIFANCVKLNDIVWHKTINYIPENTFDGCSALVEITLQPNVTNIRNNAFANCQNLYMVVIKCAKEAELNIAQDAFPLQTAKWVHLRGYNSAIDDYCATMYSRGYLFKSVPLEETKKTAKVKSVEHGKIIFASNTSATSIDVAPGTDVTVYLSGYSGYFLTDESTISIKKSEGGKVTPKSIGAGPSGSTAVTFTMPADNVDISCVFEAFNKESIARFVLSMPEESAAKGYTFKTEKDGKNYLYFDSTGITAEPVTITAYDGKGNPTVLSPSMFNWYSDNPYVSVSPIGEVTTTVMPKWAVVQGQLKADTSRKVSFHVRAKSIIAVEDLRMEFDIPSGSGITGPANRNDVDADGNYVISLPSSRVRNSNLIIPIKACPIKQGGSIEENYSVYTDWANSNGRYVAIQSAKSLGDNKIIIAKGTSGEYAITASITNTVAGVPKTVKRDIIVKVIDSTPRITVSELRINYDSETGAPFELVPVYEKDMYKGEVPTVVQKKIVGGVERIIPYTGVQITYDSVHDIYHMIATPDSKVTEGTTANFSGDTSLYIRGYYADDHGDKIETGMFDVPIARVQIYRLSAGQSVATKAKLTGKFNLFYNDARAGYVDVALDAIGESLDTGANKCFVASTNTYTTKPTGDAFTNNFNVTVINDKLVRITRSSSPLESGLNGKTANTGYLYLKYTGLKEPVKVKITVPFGVTAPSYRLATNSGKASANGSGQEFTTYLIDNKTKGIYDIVSSTSITCDSAYYTVTANPATDEITLKAVGSPLAQKVNILVKENGWETSVKYPFTVKTTAIGVLPAIKASSTVVTLNKRNIGLKDSLYLYSNNQTDASVVNIESLEFAGAASLASEAEKLKITTSAGNINVSINNASIKPGTYKYKAYPVVGYPGGSTYPTNKAVVFNVKVVNADPVVTVTTGAAKLSTVCPGNEVAVIRYKINNLPGNVQPESVSVGDVIANSANDVISNRLLSDHLIDFDFDEAGCIKVTLTGEANKYYAFTNFTGKFKLTGVEAVASNGNRVDVKDFVITVKGNGTNPVLALKAQGKLNTINPQGFIAYTATVKNINGNIDSLDVYDCNGASPVISDYFEVEEFSTGDWTTFKFYKKAGAEIDATKTYKYAFGYTLDCDSTSTVRYSTVMSIKPTQVFPKVVATEPRNSVYTGSSEANRYLVVNVDASAMPGAKIETFKLAARNGEYYNSSLEIKDSEVVDNGNGTYTFKVRVKTPSKYVVDKAYNIYVEPVYKNQVKNTTATQFAIGLFVRR